MILYILAFQSVDYGQSAPDQPEKKMNINTQGVFELENIKNNLYYITKSSICVDK